MGLLLLGWVGLTRLEGQLIKREMVGAALTLMSFPVLVFLFRLARGHFRKDLHR